MMSRAQRNADDSRIWASWREAGMWIAIGLIVGLALAAYTGNWILLPVVFILNAVVAVVRRFTWKVVADKQTRSNRN